ncbi:hypothetical protein [Actinomyces faecalis]|uniref:hypothetical protein n=1 Tax=Actinomyces faecalis TaxID=2722820 RepID=UPI001556D7A0|nr:hypothetical protein [Actinomyces faecalis]
MTLTPVQVPAGVLAGAHSWAPRVDSWLGTTWLGQVPVGSGSVSWSASQQVQGSLSLTVPRVASAGEDADARDWRPVDLTSPLACAGQVLHVSVTVGSLVTGQSWAVPLGRFLVTEWEADDQTVKVSGRSLLHRLEEDRLTTPTAPRVGGTLATELRRLVGTHMGVIIDPALADRRCPSMSWGESRIDAVYEIADAWPARLREGQDGILYVLPPAAGGQARVMSDGAEGTVIGAPSAARRDGVYNRVVARGQDITDSGAPAFQAVADQTTGPLSVSGPYGVVTKFFSSPLITSQSVAEKTAASMLATSVRRQVTVPVTHVPDPTISLDETVELVTQATAGTELIRRTGTVASVEVPLGWSETARTDVEVDQ